jgi:hypothetical protein
MYHGARDQVRVYMEKHGCQAPPEMGTAEHVLDCISNLPIEEKTDVDAQQRIDRLATIARESTTDLGIANNNNAAHEEKRFTCAHGGPRASLMIQFRLLFQRSIREIVRAKFTLVLQLVRLVSMAIIYGGIYQLGDNQASIQDWFGLLSLIVIGASSTAISKTIRSFPREKAIVSNELASSMYNTFPYFVGKALSELPLAALFNGVFGLTVYYMTGLSQDSGKLFNFLVLLVLHAMLSEAAGLVIGAFSPNSDVALAIYPAVTVLNVIFDVSSVSTHHVGL